MAAPGLAGHGEGEVWERLAHVADPELDEPITEMGFIEAVRVGRAGRVEVEFRLPTYWCSPNFAFLMADGIRNEVGALPWVSEVEVTLRDHMYAEEMSAGVNAGRPFADIFAELAGGESLDELKATFRKKAFHKRQEAALADLRGDGLAAAAIVAMSLGALSARTAGIEPQASRCRRYREIVTACGLPGGDADPAFMPLGGGRLAAGDLDAHLASLRAVRINMEFNGALCRGLQRARYREVRRTEGEEPTLVDFLPSRA